jgi:hypothetical protein
MCCPGGSTKSATMGCGVPCIVPSCTTSSSRWRGTPPTRLQPHQQGKAIRATPGVSPSAQGTSVRPAVKACCSSSAPSHASKEALHDTPRLPLAPPLPPYRSHRSCRSWLLRIAVSTTRVPSHYVCLLPVLMALVLPTPASFPSASVSSSSVTCLQGLRESSRQAP